MNITVTFPETWTKTRKVDIELDDSILDASESAPHWKDTFAVILKAACWNDEDINAFLREEESTGPECPECNSQLEWQSEGVWHCNTCRRAALTTSEANT